MQLGCFDCDGAGGAVARLLIATAMRRGLTMIDEALDLGRASPEIKRLLCRQSS